MRESILKPEAEDQTLPYVLTLKQVLVLSFFIALISWTAQSPLIKSLISPTSTIKNKALHFTEIKLTLPHNNPEIKKMPALSVYNGDSGNGKS